MTILLIVAAFVIAGAIAGWVLARLLGRKGRERVIILGACAALSAALGLLSAQPIQHQLQLRRMRDNQTAAVAACKLFAEAEEIYRRTDYDKDGIFEYAQSLCELANPANSRQALIDRSFADAEGLPGAATPKNGYVFKVLTAQGSIATGGSRNYVVDGNMTKGYALMACPAVYDETGRDTFTITNNGVIFQKDMGPETAKIMEQTSEFNEAYPKHDHCDD